ncbi:hypothetical protein ABPG72_019101 [Tetrahymena utriculariae]
MLMQYLVFLLFLVSMTMKKKKYQIILNQQCLLIEVYQKLFKKLKNEQQRQTEIFQEQKETQDSQFISPSSYLQFQQSLKNKLVPNPHSSFQINIENYQNFEDIKKDSKVHTDANRQNLSCSSIRDVVKELQINKIAYDILKGNTNKQIFQVYQIKFTNQNISSKNILKLEFNYYEVNYKMYARIKDQNTCQVYLNDKLEKYQKYYHDNDEKRVESQRIEKDIFEYLILNVSVKKSQIYTQKILSQTQK